MNDSGPESLRDILGRMFTARGWGRRQGQLHLERAWRECVDGDLVKYTRVARLRRGVFEVEVANSVLLQELAHFQKRSLLKKLRGRLTNITITDLRFRVGSWKVDG